MSNKRGITLIALIITIIVMIILVAVTVNVALNGGLFEKAKNASEQTQVETNKEALYSAVVAAMGTDGKINYTELNAEATSLGFTVKSNGVYEKDGYKYTVDNITGLITATKIGNQTPSNLTELEKYILGPNGQGITILSFSDETAGFWPGEFGAPFGHNSENEEFITDAATSIKTVGGIGDTEEDLILYISYNNDVYKFRIYVTGETEETMAYVTDANYGVQKLTIPASATNVGKRATINGEKYVVLYDAGEQVNGQTLSNVQLVSVDVLAPKDVYLGCNDNNTSIDWTSQSVITAANIFNDTEEGQNVLSDVEKSIYSYNKAIETLNTRCLTEVGANNDIEDVRCVGSNPVVKDDETSTKYSSNVLSGLPSSSSTYSAGAFQGKGKGTDQNYLADYERMMALGINVAGNTDPNNGNRPYYYWLASRYVYEDSDSVYFRMRYVNNYGRLDYDGLWNVDSDDAYGSGDSRCGVRPVVSLSSSALASYLDS